MFVDASAILAILAGESDGEALAARLEAADPGSRITSVIAAWEAAVGLYRIKRIPIAEAEARIRDFIAQAGVHLVPVAAEELSLALLAYDRYGRHRYPEAERARALNLADCFHYACAKSRRTTILHKDVGFDLTDLARAPERS